LLLEPLIYVNLGLWRNVLASPVLSFIITHLGFISSHLVMRKLLLRDIDGFHLTFQIFALKGFKASFWFLFGLPLLNISTLVLFILLSVYPYGV